MIPLKFTILLILIYSSQLDFDSNKLNENNHI